MKALTKSVLALATALSFESTARADINVVHAEDYDLNIGGNAQAITLGQRVDDPYKNDNRMYLFLQTARLRTSGRYLDYSFNLELALGGEDAVVAPSPGVTLGLLDLSFNVPVLGSKTTYVKVGQFKVPYSREQLAYEGDLQFSGRSINTLGFDVGRDVGLALVSTPGPLTLIGGVFTGGGRDIPPDHYLPQKLGFPLVAARIGVGNLDQDPFELKQYDTHADHFRSAVFINGLYTHDSTVGHSTVLNVKLADKSLLLNGNWNPYIGKAPFKQGDWWQVGADAAARTPLGAGFVASGELEGAWAGFQNEYGVVHTAGARAQVGVLRGPVDVAVRYAFLVPDEKFANGGHSITGTEPIHEITPGATYRLWNDNMKLVLDVPVTINAPVFVEKNVGSYVGTEMPDQATLLAKNGTVSHQTVVEGRLMFQARF